MVSKKNTFKIAIGILALSLATLLVPLSSAFGEGGFRAGNIISDANMYQATPSMSQAEIQRFLETQGRNCSGSGCLKNLRLNTNTFDADKYCPGSYQGANNEPVSQIIYKVSKACQINPKVLLVTIQKEQSGLTKDLTTASQRTLMGYGCPDGQPCEKLYFGVQNQLYRAARQFQLYRLNPTAYTYRAGVTKSIKYAHMDGCGASNVRIDNQATASLYNYTPYQPNQALLSGGRDRCSIDANYGFYTMYSNWFGDPSSSTPVAPATIPVPVQQGGNTGSSSNTKAQAAKEQPNIPHTASSNPTSALKSASTTATNVAPKSSEVNAPAMTKAQSVTNPKPPASTPAKPTQSAAEKAVEVEKTQQPAALAKDAAKQQTSPTTQTAPATQSKPATTTPEAAPQRAESTQPAPKPQSTSPQATAETKAQANKLRAASVEAKVRPAKSATAAAKSSNSPALASTGTIGGSVTLLAIALVIAGWRIRKSVIDNRPIRVNC